MAPQTTGVFNSNGDGDIASEMESIDFKEDSSLGKLMFLNSIRSSIQVNFL